MANIKVSDLHPTEVGLKELSTIELEGVLGGREVSYVDVDGDHIADYKVIEKNNGTVIFRPL